jgi:hypothetical protein
MSTSKKPSHPFTQNQVPTNPLPDSDTPELLRYAHNAQGLLCQRDPQTLRRFVLESVDEAQQSRRQTELLEHSTTNMVTWSHSASNDYASHFPRVVQMGLFSWPLTVCMQEPVHIKNWFTFDDQGSLPLKAELARTWAKALGVPHGDVLIHGAINTHLVAGVSPLTWQSFMRKSYQRMNAACASQVEPAVAFQENSDHTPAPHDAPWNLLGSPETPQMALVGPNQPVAFLLTAFVLWDYQKPPPVALDPECDSARRMQSLLQARFLHSRACAGTSVAMEARIPIYPELRLGQPQRMHHAMTQSQWMQLAWMAERARKTDCSFSLVHRQTGSILGWSAQLTNDEQEECASVDYCYDGFWRPIEHVRCIEQHVGLAQGTGQMRGAILDDGAA